ncbi:unnamed protein product [Medioppia subpectinata]|uniref:Uncharacterized protein n=1 Tax=Medioppia subpectinata TaxID=1979941 RepID=A0A7R9KMD2_9ACAR|nr:unnamed protein product [Medioppia subpectinata]CAG2105041.1 unnamed protein product [Medioppia subpectinata]
MVMLLFMRKHTPDKLCVKMDMEELSLIIMSEYDNVYQFYNMKDQLVANSLPYNANNHHHHYNKLYTSITGGTDRVSTQFLMTARPRN